MMDCVSACIGLGANLGNAATTVQAAVQALAQWPDSRLLAASRLYRSPAWGNEQQPDFINAAALLETALPATVVLENLLALEQVLGRTRKAGEHWQPRVIDLDLLLYGEQVIDLPQLKVPHPYLHQRGFALLPLAEIAPQALIPGHGLVQEIVSQVNIAGITPLQ